ncbi:MAG TPA: diphosphate--fructose-6-phosphate 1-phosphotransferase, partial [Gammaproteobacteria bacterium]
PHIILFPEITFEPASFLERVKKSVESYGYCVIVVSEGVRDKAGKFLADSGSQDAFGHAQLGGVAPIIAQLVKNNLGYKHHYAIADYLQRAARHIASATDIEQAYAVGKSAVELAIAGKNAVMPTIVRTSDDPYKWEIGYAKLADIANIEKKMPRNYITADGFSITADCRRYLGPLIRGEDYPPYSNGLPRYIRLKNIPVEKKLGGTFKMK